MTNPKTPTAATAPPSFAAGLPPLTQLPDPPGTPDMAPQMPDLTRALSILDNRYRACPDTVVMGNCYLIESPISLYRPYPHCMVSFGMTQPKAEIIAANEYTIGKLGKPPDFVLEIASNSPLDCDFSSRDYPFMQEIYAAYGVPEYWRFDGTGGDYYAAALTGDRLTAAGGYEPLPIARTPEGISRGYSAVLELELHWYAGRLCFWDPDADAYLPDLPEMQGQRDAARAERDDALAQLAAAQELIRQLQNPQQ